MNAALLLALLLAGFPAPPTPAPLAHQTAPDGAGADEARREAIQSSLEAFVAESPAPGASLALILPGGEELTFTAGMADADAGLPLEPTHRLLAGSVGKTYVSAAALHLVSRGLLDLDAPVSEYLGDEAWYPELPNADGITVRQLLRHQSGLPRYVYLPAFWKELLSDVDRTFEPAELVSFVLGQEPRFDPGEGFAYSDTNYLLVGMILEKVSGESFYGYVRERLLAPHGLVDTVPSDSRKIERIAQGHVVTGQGFGIAARTLEDGLFTFNPQFEWCGGGWATTPLDLARWARIVYEGQLFEGEYLEELYDAVRAPELGPGKSYGLGVMLEQTELGRALGHDGFMPGYVTSVRHFPEHGLTAALQVNSDDLPGMGPLEKRLVRLASLAVE